MQATSQNHSRINIYGKIVIWLLLLSPILQTYGMGPFVLSELLTWFVFLIAFIRKDIKLQMPRRLRLYFIYLLIVTFFSCIGFTSEIIVRCLGVVHVALVFFLFFSITDIGYLYKSYKKIAIASIALFFLQEFSYATTGIRISGLIPFLQLNSTFSNFENTYSFKEFLTIVNRSSSFFSEPAYLAQYIIPFIPLAIYYEEKKKKIIYVGMTVSALFMMMSGNGIIGLSVLAIIYSIYYFNKVSSYNKIFLVFVMAACIVFGGRIFLSSESGKKYLNRSDEIMSVSGQADDLSGFVRIYLGYYVYNEYNVLEKIVGVNNFTVLKARVNQTKYGSILNDVLYFNTIQHFLLKSGIVGLLFFLFFLKDIYIKNNICGRALVLVFFVFSFISSMYLTSFMIMYLLFAMRIKDSSKRYIALS